MCTTNSVLDDFIIPGRNVMPPKEERNSRIFCVAKKKEQTSLQWLFKNVTYGKRKILCLPPNSENSKRETRFSIVIVRA